MVAEGETAILVQYELEGQLYAPDGVTVITEKSDSVKKIKVKTLNASTDLDALAAEIVDKCKLIHHSKTSHVRALLAKLRDRDAPDARVEAARAAKAQATARARATSDARASDASRRSSSSTTSPSPSSSRRASGGWGEAARERERRSSRGGGTGSGAGSSSTPGDWLGEFASGGVDVVAEEMERLRVREEERMLAEAEAEGAFDAHASVPVHLPQCKAHLEDVDDYLERLYDEDMAVKVDATLHVAALARRAENLDALADHPTLPQTLARVLREDGRRSVDLATNIVSVFFALSNFSQYHPLISQNQLGDMTMRVIDLEIKRTEDRRLSVREMDEPPDEFAARRLATAERKQDRLLYVCFYMLLNLSEDPSVERKMKKRNISAYLCKMLERRSVDLLVLSVTFLKKLSIYRENKDAMKEANVVDKLARFVPGQDVLLLVTLRLLLNLSFDEDLRAKMVARNLVPRVVELMKNPHFQHVSMALLYHLSMDDAVKSMFAHTNAVPVVLDFLLQVEDLHAAPELIALAVNLTHDDRCAAVMCETVAEGGGRERGFDLLVRRALRLRDPLAFKVIRNLSERGDRVKAKFAPYLPELIRALKEEEPGSDLMVEVLGTLGNLHCASLDMTETCVEHGLFEYAAILLSPGEVDDDVALEAVVFVGSVVCEENARLVVDAGLVESIYALMREKKDDDEFVLQIAHAFRRMLRCGATRDALVRSTQAVFYLVDLLQDVNDDVRKTADAALDAVMDADEELAVQIRRLKFEAHNAEWLDAVDRDLGVDGSIPGARDEAAEEGLGGGGRRYHEAEGPYSDDDDDSPTLGVRSPGFVYDDPARFYEDGAYDDRGGGGGGGEYY